MEVISNLGLGFAVALTLQPESALILLAGIYYGAQYGGSTTAILVNIPGEASSVVTTIDGHQMARQGRAGPALGIAALGSFFAGCVSTLLIAFAAPPLAAVALQFGPAEYFSLMVCGLVAAVVLADGIEFVALSMAIYGLAEVAYNLEKKQETSIVSGAVGRVWPSLADLRYCIGSILRGTGLGAIL